jgi:hypothetical protein
MTLLLTIALIPPLFREKGIITMNCPPFLSHCNDNDLTLPHLKERAFPFRKSVKKATRIFFHLMGILIEKVEEYLMNECNHSKEMPRFPKPYWRDSAHIRSFPQLNESIHVDAAVVGAGCHGSRFSMTASWWKDQQRIR